MSVAEGLTGELDRIRRNWVWYVLLGMILILIGAFAITQPLIVSLATMKVLGFLLIISGVAEIVVALQTRGWSGITLNLLAGILEIVVGLMILRSPVETLVVFTMLFTIYLLVGGVFRIAAAVALRVPGSFWLVLSGIITTLLGVMLLAAWPEPTEWLVGTFVGVDFLMYGISWIVLALNVRGSRPAIA